MKGAAVTMPASMEAATVTSPASSMETAAAVTAVLTRGRRDARASEHQCAGQQR